MNTLNRLIQGSVIGGFLILSSGCVIAPDGEHGRMVGDRDHERRDDHDRHERDDRRCDYRDEHCRDR